MLKTPADWITGARFVLALVVFGLLTWLEKYGPAERHTLYWTAFVVFVVAAVTDAVDGAVARRTGMSDFGRIADPFVDKVLVVGSLVFLAAIPATQRIIPAWAVVLIVAREFLVTGIRGFVESKGLQFPADKWGKAKMVLQCCAAGAGLLVLAIDPSGHLSKSGRGFLYSYGEGESTLDSVISGVPTLTRGLVWLSVILTVGSGISYVVRASRMLAAAPRASRQL
jgi:CDP-diacylglycerol--glycerol-3-phosphate 3-phosphatidyltransferase